MKKIFLLAALAVLVSCSQEDNMEEQRPAENGIYMTACDFTLDNETRTSLALDEQEGLLFSWSDGDVVGVFGSVNNQQVPLYMTDGKDTQTATFRSDDYQLSPNSSYVAYYPIIDKVTAEPKVPVDYTGQTQTGNNSYSHLPEYDYMVSDKVTPESLNNAHFTFAHVGCILRLCIEMPRAGRWSEVTLTTSDAAFTTKATLDLFGTTLITDAQKSASVSLSLNGVTTQKAGDEVTAWMMLLPADLSSKEITVTVKAADGGDDAVFVVEQGKDFKSGKAYSITIKDGIKAVDLGLPSGTLWGDRNLGAVSTSDYGDLYGFGATDANLTSINNYDYFYNNTDGTYAYPETNVPDFQERGDWWSIQGTASDAATVNLGTDWHIPNPDQFYELMKYCNASSVTLANGVKAVRFKNTRNGKYIDVPLAGFRLGTTVNNRNIIGRFWLTFYNANWGGTYQKKAYFADMVYNGMVDPNFSSTSTIYAGLSIRPVKDK